MKRLTSLFLFSFVLILFQEVNAQIRIAPRVGLNINTVNFGGDIGEDFEDPESRVGFQIGAIADLPITEEFSIRPGVLFSSKGYKEQLDSPGFDEDFKVVVNYLEIPVSANYQFAVGEGFGIDLNIGPYIGLALGGESKIGDDDESLNIGNDEEDDDVRGFDFGFNFGGGVEYQNISLGLNYALGLYNLTPGGGDDVRIKNRVFSITLGYFFEL